MPLFDDYLVCDWSAANTPKLGKDSIWIATAARTGETAQIQSPVNIRTRAEAMATVQDICHTAINNGRRLFAGFDFAFGYPAGTAKAITGRPDWQALWQHLHQVIEDDDSNRSNRYKAAAALNRAFGPHTDGPFWGHPHQHAYDGLLPTKPAAMPEGITEKRHAERTVTSAKSVWQLAYTGAVGSQSLLGIARLQALRADPALQDHIAIWPFETAFADRLDKPVTIAEVYPSAFPVRPFHGEVKDAAQVRTLAQEFARLDAEDRLKALLARPAGLSDNACRDILAEEGWIVGATVKGSS